MTSSNNQSNIAGDKPRARLELRQALREVSVEELKMASQAACSLLAQQAVWRKARCVLAYAPVATEINLLPLMITGVEQGKAIALPRFSHESVAYEMRRFTSLSKLDTGAFGVREPRGDAPLIPANQLDLILIPGLGFGLDGGRLGRGGGHYDRILETTGGCRCGVAMDVQVRSVVPLEPHDKLMNCILTPTRWLTIREEPDER
jgi:5-formyltetrahydrofolate cyclo-ligase